MLNTILNHTDAIIIIMVVPLHPLDWVIHNAGPSTTDNIPFQVSYEATLHPGVPLEIIFAVECRHQVRHLSYRAFPGTDTSMVFLWEDDHTNGRLTAYVRERSPQHLDFSATSLDRS